MGVNKFKPSVSHQISSTNRLTNICNEPRLFDVSSKVLNNVQSTQNILTKNNLIPISEVPTNIITNKNTRKRSIIKLGYRNDNIASQSKLKTPQFLNEQYL